MATWHCDYTNGNDTTGDGSSGTPYKTIQKCVDVATGGDTVKIANTSAQILAAAITWTTGYTAVSNKGLVFVAWDNGGALTIQRPDESVARMASHISGNSTVTEFLNTASRPAYITIDSLKFSGFTGGGSYMVRLGLQSVVVSSEFDCGDISGLNSLETSSFSFIFNNYCHSMYNTSTAGAVSIAAQSWITSNFIIGEPTYFSRILLNAGGNQNTVYGNIIKLIGSGIGIDCNAIVNVFSNTIISDGATATQYGIRVTTGRNSVYNNMLYNFDGTGNVPIFDNSTTLPLLVYGNNALFDCNAASTFSNVLKSYSDVTGTGDPFVASGSNDYSVTGSTAEGVGLGTTSYSSIDIGAVQGASGGGGGGGASAYTFVG